MDGRLVVATPARLATATARSHLADGRCVGLVDVTGRWAVDAELDRNPPPALIGRFGPESFWERWTRAECAAKLADVPMVLWLERHGLEDPDPARFELSTQRLEGGSLVVSLGRLVDQSTRSASTSSSRP